MNNTTKALIGLLVLVGLWIGYQQMSQRRPEAAPACSSTATGGG